ncbi:phage tail tube protein [Streptobacillus moniliformis]|uniref:phage tail tube protein n=1 Tax=Streptobacillus moniliformis TaxID=34105 RepID=UPI0007E37B89|nr:phage tail tube protein [Streptobacillus moniliformis]
MPVYIGKQTKKGTSQTTNSSLKRLGAKDFNITESVQSKESEQVNEVGVTQDAWVSEITVGGDVSIETSLGQLEMLIENAGFKKETTSPPATPNISTYKLDNKFDTFLTVVQDDPVSQSYDVFQDLQINTLKVDTALQSYVNTTIGFLGLKAENKTTEFSSNGTQEFDGKLLICLGTTITEKGTDKTAEIDSLSIDITNSLQSRGALNDVYHNRIHRDGLRTFKINFKYNLFDKQSYHEAKDLLKKSGDYEVKVKFKEQGTENHVEFVFHKCKISDVKKNDVLTNPTTEKELIAVYDTEKKTPVTITFNKKA